MPSRRAADSTTLTIQELQAAYLAHFDLGPGYPQLPVSSYARSIYLDDALEDLSLRFAPFWTPHKQQRVAHDLEHSVASFLDLPSSKYASMHSTFSGSIALDRIISAVQRLARNRKLTGLRVIGTTPCIDIMDLFLAERIDISRVYARSQANGQFGSLDADRILQLLAEAEADSDTTQTVLLLSSPENPTGAVWASDQLATLALRCKEASAVLIVDHCFVVAGIHDVSVPRIWDHAPSGLNWCAVWDTGKTFGLNEDKLGILISGSEIISDNIRDSMAVLQFDVARRQKLFFAELLRQADYHDHIGSLRSICRTNLETLTHQIDRNSVCSVVVPSAGTLALIDVSQTGVSDEVLRVALLKAQIGVVAGNVFFHDDWCPTNYLRIALARDPEHFAKAIERMCSVIQTVGGKAK